MEIMPKRKLPSGTKVKRLTLYPRQKYSFEKSEAEAPKKPEEKSGGQWRWIPTREKPEMKAPEKLPYYKELPPKYEAPAEPPAGSRPETPPWAKKFLVVIGVFVIPLALVLGVLIIKEIDWGPDGGGGGAEGGIRVGGSRGCVSSSMGYPPTCSDDPQNQSRTQYNRGGDGTCKNTEVNGRNFGKCLKVTNRNACVPC